VLSEDHLDVERQPRSSPHRSGTRVLVAAVVVGLVAMWVYVIYLAFGPGRQPPIDRLEDPAFAPAAEQRCARAVAEIDELPPASEQTTASQRANVVDQANTILAGMLTDLDEAAGRIDDEEERARAEAWLVDWRVLLDDRTAYAQALRRDAGARLLVSEKDDTGRHITGWIDEFAKANQMSSCATPGDV
jgi:hypothetical protein